MYRDEEWTTRDTAIVIILAGRLKRLLRTLGA